MKKILVVALVKNPRLSRPIDLSIILSVYAATIKLISQIFCCVVIYIIIIFLYSHKL